MHSSLARMLVVYTGGDYIFDLTVTDDDGTLIDLTGATLTWQVRLQLDDAAPLIDKETGAGITHAADQPGTGKGLAELAVAKADWPAIGHYYWGLWLKDAVGNRQPLREYGSLHVKAAVVQEPAP